MTVKHVRQEDELGCTVASLAMITGQSYADVRAAFSTDFNQDGITHHTYDVYLAAHGYALRRFHEHDPIAKKTREPWPVEPFADVHLCCVDAGGSRGAHCVVMLADGSVLDPLSDRPKRLGDYARVYNVAGVYQVEATPRRNEVEAN